MKCECGLDHGQRVDGLTKVLLDGLNAVRATPREAASALAMARVNLFLSVPAELHGAMWAVELGVMLGSVLRATHPDEPSNEGKRRCDA